MPAPGAWWAGGFGPGKWDFPAFVVTEKTLNRHSKVKRWEIKTPNHRRFLF